MAVAHDAVSESHTGITGSVSEASFTWNHDPVGTPKGVLVFVMQNGGVSDFVGTVTYDGEDVPAVSGGLAVDTAGEVGWCKAYFLGSGINTTDPAAVVVNRTNNANEMWAAAVTVTAATDTEIYLAGIVLLQGDGTLAEQNVDDGTPGTNSVRYAGINSGLGNVPGAGTSSTALVDIDFTARVDAVNRETTAGQGSRAVGFSSASTDDRAAVHLAVREAAGGAATVTPATIAVVAALPTPAVLAASLVAPSVIAAVAALPTPTVSIPATVTPTVIPAITALPTPSILAASKVTPAAIAAVAALPTPSILAASLVTPTTIAAVAALPAPAILAASKVLPATIALVVSLPTPTIDVAGGTTTVFPATIAALVTLPTPQPVVPALVAPAVIAAVTALPTPSILLAPFVTPATIALVVGLPTPTLSIPGLVTPATVAVVVTFPTPTLTMSADVTPATIAVLVTLPTPTVTVAGNVSPATITLIVNLPTPQIIIGAVTFWTVNSVAYTLNPAAFIVNPAAYVPVGGGDDPPW